MKKNENFRSLEKFAISEKENGYKKLFAETKKSFTEVVVTRPRPENGRECLKQKAVDMSTNCCQQLSIIFIFY